MPETSRPDARSNLVWSIHRQAERDPSHAALWIDGAEISYGELADRAARIATWLRTSGVGRGQRVGILASRSLLAYTGILGTCWSGAAYVPLHPSDPPARTAELVSRARLDALIVDRRGAANWRAFHSERRPIHVLCETSPGSDSADGSSIDDARVLALAPFGPPEPVAVDDLAYLMFTSGTTGVPKGVMVSIGAVNHFLGVARDRYRFSPTDRASQFFELTFDLSVFDLFVPWSAGAMSFCVPESQRMSPLAFLRAHRLTTWFAVPSSISFLERTRALQPGSLPSLRLSLFCGEPLPVDSARAWRAAAPHGSLENLYGPTEATVACLSEPCADAMRVTPERGIVAIGTPFPGMHAAVLANDGTFAASGQPGELLLSGPQLAQGYWDDPESTALRFRIMRHPRLGERCFYSTQDLAYESEEGCFHFLGRADHQVKIRGFRVELEEIEAHLQAICGLPAAAVAWPIQHGSAEGVVAFVTVPESDFERIRERLRERLPWYMVPRRIHTLDQLPLTPNGKIDRAALARLLGA